METLLGDCGLILLSPHTWLWEQAKGKMSLGDVHHLRKGVQDKELARQRRQRRHQERSVVLLRVHLPRFGSP